MVVYLVDTNIFIYARDDVEPVLRKFEEHASEIALSALSLAELHRGLYPADRVPPLRLGRHETLIRHIRISDFNIAAAMSYGTIVATIGRQKARDVDHMIAAHALSLGAVFVTNNLADFAGIPGLSVENWAQN